MVEKSKTIDRKYKIITSIIASIIFGYFAFNNNSTMQDVGVAFLLLISVVIYLIYQIIRYFWK